jgi:hypothetical protein
LRTCGYLISRKLKFYYTKMQKLITQVQAGAREIEREEGESRSEGRVAGVLTYTRRENQSSI